MNLDKALCTFRLDKEALLSKQASHLAVLQHRSNGKVLGEGEGAPGDEVGEGGQGNLLVNQVHKEHPRPDLLLWLEVVLLQMSLFQVLAGDRAVEDLKKADGNAVRVLLLKQGVHQHARLERLH